MIDDLPALGVVFRFPNGFAKRFAKQATAPDGLLQYRLEFEWIRRHVAKFSVVTKWG
jgi:hypothetical protein